MSDFEAWSLLLIALAIGWVAFFGLIVLNHNDFVCSEFCSEMNYTNYYPKIIGCCCYEEVWECFDNIERIGGK